MSEAVTSIGSRSIQHQLFLCFRQYRANHTKPIMGGRYCSQYEGRGCSASRTPASIPDNTVCGNGPIINPQYCWKTCGLCASVTVDRAMMTAVDETGTFHCRARKDLSNTAIQTRNNKCGFSKVRD